MAKDESDIIAELDPNMAVRPVDSGDLEFHSWQEKPFRLAGCAFRKELHGELRRIPEDWKVSDGVDYLASNTAGMSLAFRSNSAHVVVKAKLRYTTVMSHMPQTGSSGFDLYVGGPGAWRSCGAGYFPLQAPEMQVEIGNFKNDGRIREFLMHFPLYNGVTELEIGLDKGSGILPPTPWSDPKPLVVYGTSITQGGCASRPGMAWTNILSRRFNREIYNFGFSGSGMGETAMAEILAKIENPAGFVLDYDANAALAGLRNTLKTMIGVIRKTHPDVPVTVISVLPSGSALTGSLAVLDDHFYYQELMEESRAFQKNVLAELTVAGDRNLYFIDGTQLLGKDWDECTVDSIHLTDLGFYRMADALEKCLVWESR